jgi:hypothetical protein
MSEPIVTVGPDRGVVRFQARDSRLRLAQLGPNDWESEFFARRQATVSIDFESLSDSNGPLSELLAFVAASSDRLGYDLTELRVGARRFASIPEIESAGFRLVEIRLEMLRLIEKGSEADRPLARGELRWASERDLPSILDLNQACFVDNDAFYSRFKNPTYHSVADTERYYSTWVTNHFGVEGTGCVVVDLGGELAGYTLSEPRGSRRGNAVYGAMIGGVSAAHRGLNTGRAMNSFLFRSFPEERFYWHTVTQLSNFAMLTHHLQIGAHIESADCIFYRSAEGAQGPRG